jgi:hypothetical protein
MHDTIIRDVATNHAVLAASGGKDEKSNSVKLTKSEKKRRNKIVRKQRKLAAKMAQREIKVE